MKTIRASATPRIFKCTASYTETQIESESSDAAEEGTAAHWVAQSLLQGTYKNETIAPNGVVITAEMFQHALEYAKLVTAPYAPPGPWGPCNYFIEQEVEFQVNNDYRVLGHVDHAFYDQVNEHLVISDLKYGYRIVEPNENWQLLCYAYGMISTFKMPIHKVTLRIYQPRPGHPLGSDRTWTVNREQLDVYWKKLREAVRAIDIAPELATGPHCRYCWRMVACPAARQAAYNAVDVSQGDVDLAAATNDELSFEMDALRRGKDALGDRLKAIEEEALARISAGKRVPGYERTFAPGRTAWKEYVTVDFLEAVTGKSMKNDKIVTPAEARRRGMDEVSLAFHSEKKAGKAMLSKIDVDQLARRYFDK